MILDYQNNPGGENEQRFKFGRCLVDGNKVGNCFYIDTEAGVVKGTDVLGDGRPHASDALMDNPDLTNDPSIILETHNVAYKIYHGKVELFTKDGVPL